MVYVHYDKYIIGCIFGDGIYYRIYYMVFIKGYTIGVILLGIYYWVYYRVYAVCCPYFYLVYLFIFCVA